MPEDVSTFCSTGDTRGDYIEKDPPGFEKGLNSKGINLSHLLPEELQELGRRMFPKELDILGKYMLP